MHDDTGTVNIALLGAAGRMGHAIIEAAHDYSGVRISATLVQSASPLLGQSANDVVKYSADMVAAVRDCDVLLDFATPTATGDALAACLAARKPLVIGVTGMDAALRQRIEIASREIAVLTAANMSLGVNLLLQLARSAAARLDASFDIEISDAHHRHKQDAPSGTALALGEAVAAGRGVRLDDHAVFGRGAHSGVRGSGSIGFSSIRAGEIVGEHSVLFAGPGERLELVHHAENRGAFARGALTAARWLAGRPAGLYGMDNVLGLPAQH